MTMRREPIAEGIFYPDSAAALRRTIRTALADATAPRADANLIVAPHGPIDYTQRYVAAAMRAAAMTKPEVIVVIGPVGVEADQRVLLPESDLFGTPLGDLRVDVAMVHDLLELGTHIVHDEIAHLRDHTIEVQLPWLRVLFDGSRIVPILTGRLTPRLARATATAIRLATHGRRFLTVVSANLSSYGSVEQSLLQSRRVVNALCTHDSRTIFEVLASIEPRPSGTDALALGHILATGCQVELLQRGNVEIESDEGVRAVECGAIAYYCP